MKLDVKKLQLAMARACKNRSDLAEAAGVKPTAISNYIKGYSKRPSPKTLGLIAKALECDPADLIADEG